MEAWLRLVYLPGFNTEAKRHLVEQLGSAQSVISTANRQLHEVLADTGFAVSRRTVTAKAGNPPHSKAIEQIVTQDMAQLAALGARYLPFNDPGFPALLNQVDCPPLGLFCLGDPMLLQNRQLAIVGSRRATRSGGVTATRFAGELCAAGLTITSGLALGIDAAAHQGALNAGGHTIAVIATGIDRIYPWRNRQLHQRIATTGLLVSEFPPGSSPRRSNFPRRNRIISGLSLATLVVEAGLRSGSLITARLAAEQGRDVFAIPGSIYSEGSRGCHFLLRQGAALVESSEDILLELGFATGGSNPASTHRQSAADSLEPELAQLYALIDHAPCALNELIELSGLTADQVSSILVRLEMRGLVSETLGGYQRLPPGESHEQH